MRENCKSGSEGGGTERNSLPLCAREGFTRRSKGYAQSLANQGVGARNASTLRFDG